LRAQIVDLVRLDFLKDAGEVGAIAEIAVVQLELGRGRMGILIDVIDALGVEQRGAPFDPIDLIALGEQEFGKIGPVLSGDAGNQGYLGRGGLAHQRSFSELAAVMG